MISFYAYTPDGRITMTGFCPVDQLPYQRVVGATVEAGAADHKTQYRSSDGALVDLPAQPSPNHVFDYTTKTWVTDNTLAETSVRAKRGKLLNASDWTQLPDVPLETKAAWAVYRQALRDVTEQPGFPADISWPGTPE